MNDNLPPKKWYQKKFNLFILGLFGVATALAFSDPGQQQQTVPVVAPVVQEQTLQQPSQVKGGVGVNAVAPDSGKVTNESPVEVQEPETQQVQPAPGHQVTNTDSSDNGVVAPGNTNNLESQTVRSQSSPQVPESNSGYYYNVDGNRVESPHYSDEVPADATAKCRDGTYSSSQHRQGTCSHHGGVEEWY